MENKKYELTRETKNIDSNIVYRIRSLIDFETVNISIHKGDLGGFISSEENLSHNGNCWVFDNAAILDNSRLMDNAVVRGNAIISGNTTIIGNTYINASPSATISNSEISGSSVILHSYIQNCKINSSRISISQISDSQIDYISEINDSLISDSQIHRSKIIKCIIDDSEIESPIYNSKVKYGVIKNNYGYINMGPFHRESYTFYKGKNGAIFARENNPILSEGFFGNTDCLVAWLKDFGEYNKKSEDMIEFIKTYLNGGNEK